MINYREKKNQGLYDMFKWALRKFIEKYQSVITIAEAKEILNDAFCDLIDEGKSNLI